MQDIKILILQLYVDNVKYAIKNAFINLCYVDNI